MEGFWNDIVNWGEVSGDLIFGNDLNFFRGDSFIGNIMLLRYFSLLKEGGNSWKVEEFPEL